MTHRGMTLVEMLVALAATLLLMTAIAQAFSVFGSAISESRSVLELDSRMRTAAWRLRADLAGATARPVPPLGPDGGEGYLEIIEGPATDLENAAGTSMVGQTVSGDFDDALLLTTRSSDTPFIGRAFSNSASPNTAVALVESTLAEVAWFARPTPGTTNPGTYTLYRRQALILGYAGTGAFHSTIGENNRIAVPATTTNGTVIRDAPDTWADYFDLPCDVSARLEVTASGTYLYPNTLADLTRRECRFMHNVSGVTTLPVAFGNGVPLRSGTWAFVDHLAPSTSSTVETLPANVRGLVFDSTSQRQGDDVVLTNVLSFDVRVFDPGAPVFITTGSTALVPGDPGFTNSPAASGAYVDLGHGVANNSLLTNIVASGNAARFSGAGQAKSGLIGSGTNRRTYDTWSRHYEANGLDEDNDGVDEGTNGIDDNGDGSFDEPAADANGDGVFETLGETETLPPYPVPLRGIEIRIRCYEPSSRQVRQVTVRHTFVPH